MLNPFEEKLNLCNLPLEYTNLFPEKANTQWVYTGLSNKPSTSSHVFNTTRDKKYHASDKTTSIRSLTPVDRYEDKAPSVPKKSQPSPRKFICGPSVSVLGTSNFTRQKTGAALSAANTSQDKDYKRQLQTSRKKFSDPEFPPTYRSLTGGLSAEELAKGGSTVDWENIQWLRADEIFKGNYNLFQGKIEPDDVRQLELGDCYLLSTIASIAQIPERIKQLFIEDFPNQDGRYIVKLCDGGIWREVVVDDYFPCTSEKKPIFIASNGGELWVLILEKAWAKVYGSYARIEGGLPQECLHDLTGAPTEAYSLQAGRNEEVWNVLMTAQDRKYITTCGTDVGTGDFDAMGLFSKHAYSLLSAFNMTIRPGVKVRLVKLRNPWGKGEWNGTWSDQSNVWTPELKKQVNFQSKEDGDFYMSFQDFCHYFESIQICRFHDNFFYNAKKVCSNPNGTYFKITIRIPGHYFFTVNQESSRKHPPTEDYRYGDVFLLIAEKNENGHYFKEIKKADKEVWLESNLEAGEYIIHANVVGNYGKAKEFCLSSYGEGKADIMIIYENVDELFKKIYRLKAHEPKTSPVYQHNGAFNYSGIDNDYDSKNWKPYKDSSKIYAPSKSEEIAMTRAPRTKAEHEDRSRFMKNDKYSY